MLPLSLDLTRLNLVLIGNGSPGLRRLRLLEEAGARALAVFCADPASDFAAAAGHRLHCHWPKRDELRGAQLVFIAGLPEPQRTAVAGLARSVGAILHVEDAPALTDSHAPAILRRGGLTVAVATNGAAPGLASEIRDFLAGQLAPEWSERVERVAALRRLWRARGAHPADIRRLTAARIGRSGWLKGHPPATAANDRGIDFKEPTEGNVS